MRISLLNGGERASYVHSTFTRIAKQYSRMNRLMTFGQDTRWRKEAIRQLRLAPGMSLLDLGTGTGDLGREALRQEPAIRLTAADFNYEMMLAGQASGPLPWLLADALCLPFSEQAFDAVVSGFLMRNVSSLSGVLKEQCRVLKPGGRIVILETTHPRSGVFTPLVWIYMQLLIPFFGKIIAHDREAYRYLPASSKTFLSAEELVEQMSAAGFRNIGFKRRMFGTIAIHWGDKP